eukprot:snap_masked-scaffold_11-processed-gene-10.19-mRNA-1 protein AED:1.00 eAED:1.00 QI:0/-1/0/0/-1/1/1/0/60
MKSSQKTGDDIIPGTCDKAVELGENGFKHSNARRTTRNSRVSYPRLRCGDKYQCVTNEKR